MTAPTQPTAHEELAFLDEIERELVKLTTAVLEARDGVPEAMPLPRSSPSPITLKTVKPS